MPEDTPYDPYIPGGQGAAPQQQGAGGNARTQALQAVSLPLCLQIYVASLVSCLPQEAMRCSQYDDCFVRRRSDGHGRGMPAR
jgi:hypothetical protein